MTALLEDRVALWLSSHPDKTCDEIARGVSARRQSVREVLDGPLFTWNMVDTRVLFRLRGARDGLGRPRTGTETDTEFLRRVLSDGMPHNLNSILAQSFRERGCGLTVHSRAADLRKQGLNVVNWKDGPRGNGSWYQLGEATDSRRSSGHTQQTPGWSVASPSRLETAADAQSSGRVAAAVETPASAVASSRPDTGIPGTGGDRTAQLCLSGPEFRRSEAA